jgi:hypothetical protein
MLIQKTYGICRFANIVQDRTKTRLSWIYLEFCLKATGENPVCFLKNLIK